MQPLALPLKFFHLVMRFMLWLGFAQHRYFAMAYEVPPTDAAEHGGFGILSLNQAGQMPSPPSITQATQYEGSFDLPAEGEDPFSHVARLRTNALAVKSSNMSEDMKRWLTELVGALIHEEAQHVQLENDLWLIEETKNAVDVLHGNPAMFPSTRYTLREGEKGELYVRDVVKDVLGAPLPKLKPPPPEEHALPIEFGYDTTNRRTARFSFGDSVVTVTSGAALKSGGAVGVSHGTYNVTIGTGDDSTEATISAGPVMAQSFVSPNDVKQEVRVGEMQVKQQIKPSMGPGSIVAGYKDFQLKLNTDPKGKAHGAEANTKDFGITVSRDFDDRVNVIKQRVGPYSVQLDSDLADDKNHAYNAKITANTPQTGKMILGGGFDESNSPTTAVALQAKDMGIAFNGSRAKRDYNLRIGPFVFDVVMTGDLPEFILRDILA